MSNVIFETERLVVKQFVFETDAENFFLINGDEEVMRYIRAPKTREECDEFLKQNIEGYRTNPLMGRWSVHEKHSGKYVGSFAFIPVEGTEDSQLGYALLKEFWGKGFATELTKEGIRYVFSKTGLDAVYGITLAQNLDSQKVLLKAGFKLHRSYREEEKDVCSFVITRDEA